MDLQHSEAFEMSKSRGDVRKKKTQRSKKTSRGLAALKRESDEIRKSFKQKFSNGRKFVTNKDFRPGSCRFDGREMKPRFVAGTSFRRRLNYCILTPVDFDVPSCPHGPCLLFARRNANWEISEKQFACAVYRSGECPFRWRVTDDELVEETNPEAVHRLRNATINEKCRYGKIRKSLRKLTESGNDIYYCRVCNDATSAPHRDPVIGPFSKTKFKKPTRLIDAVTEDSREAQYWFTDESLKVITKAINANGCDGVLCIGTPTVFEYFRSTAHLRKTVRSFLLDVDPRFGAFYFSSQFAQYSMLTNHFFDPKSLPKFEKFLASVRHLVIVCDPPFGVFVDPLMKTIDQLRCRFCTLHSCDETTVNVLLVLPFFAGKHVKAHDSKIEVMDYAVCYTNHPKYKSSEKSIVRLFTDLPPATVVLPEESGYRFCSMCDRYVSAQNRHCGICGICPSKDGSTYKHCERCSRCVKPAYNHCSACMRCHLPGRCIKHSKN